MKIRVTLKDPDGFSNSVDEAVTDALESIEGLDDDEREELLVTRTEKVWKGLEPWVKYSEYVTIEFDTEAGTATVVKR